MRGSGGPCHHERMTSTSIDPATTIGAVRLTVADLPRVRTFYEQALGLRALAEDPDDGVVVLGTGNGTQLLELVGRADAPLRTRSACGLFHLALLYPTRTGLAHALRRLLRAGAELEGASDHLVSEALYLSDPEGNGIELYRDRPREEWTHEPGGELRMATLPLDLRALFAEAPTGDVAAAIPEGTRMGHVHLQVADLASAEAFYAGLLGFDVMVRGYSGALFLAAGGYHHHIGLNTWASRGGAPNEPGTRGLDRFVVQLPDADALAAVAARLAQAGVATRDEDGGLLVADPFGNGLLLRD